MRFLSLFAGVGGFDLGFERAGMEPVAQVEIDSKCRTVLQRHWPDVERHDDVRTFDGTRFAGTADVVCGGFPCQDVSVAGRRAGMAEGTRSGLFYEAVRIVGECRPRWVVIENVPGLLTSNKREDFRSVLSALDDLGYGVAWRVLDSRWFGVPQRRRRVFIVGCLGAVVPAFVALHPECEGGGGHPAKGAERDEAPAADTGPGAGGPSFVRQLRTDSWTEDTEAGTILARVHKGEGSNSPGLVLHTELYENHPNDGRVRGPMDQASTVSARYGTGGNNTDLVLHGPPLSFNWQEARTFRAYEDQTNPLTANQTQAVLHGAVVRRLTPVECERLQGFPDGWTEGLPDGARYRMLGNAVTVNVAEWLGRRILKAEREFGSFGKGRPETRE